MKKSRRFYTSIFLLSMLPFSTLSSQTTKTHLDQKEKKELIKKISDLVKDNYVFPDLGEKYGKQIRSLSKSDEFETIRDPKEFGKTVTTVLQRLMNDKHINFRLIEASVLNENKEGSLHHPVRYFRLGQKEHLGIYRLDWIENEIGYMDFRRFYNHSKAKKMLINAFKFLSSANAVIIDLRENQGGSGDLIPLLLSYFLPHPTQLTGTYYRDGDITKEAWTLEKVEGEQLFDVPLFILIGKNTFSAAEYFAYDLKVRKRAIFVGEASKGGAHSVDLYPVGDHFEIYISTARAINPVTGDNWEGTGVIPDINVFGISALDTTIILAKKAAQEYAKVENVKIIDIVQKMQKHLDQAVLFYKEDNPIKAESVLDSAFQNGLQADLIDEFFIQVLSYHYSSLKNYKMSIWMLNEQIKLFPESLNGYEALAWAYYNQGEKKLAIKQFEKVLQLDERNSIAKEMVKKIKY